MDFTADGVVGACCDWRGDAVWLYGGTKADIVESITYSRAGVMPAWTEKLDDETIRQLTIYVHSLGGGQ